MTEYTVGLVGGTGRMGTLVDDHIEGLDGYVVTARPGRGGDWSVLDDVDIVFDVSNLDVSRGLARYCIDARKKLIIGTSGWTDELVATLKVKVAAAPGTGILIVPNFAVGSVLASRLAARAAATFPAVEIVEAHHAAKADAPSGTSMRTRDLINRVRPQKSQPIPIHSIRLPGIIAKQTTFLGGAGEYITITHETTSTDAYLAGITLALSAAPELEGVQVGLDRLLGFE